MVTFVLSLYFLFQLGLGYLVSRSIKTESDYLIAGRKLGPWLASFSIFATWFGAETCIGAAGSIYQTGLSGGTADPFGYALCILFMGLLLAVPLWKKGLVTLGDLFRIHYGKDIEKLATMIMIPTSILWAAAQIRAFGMVLSGLSGVDIGIMISAAALIVILYTYLGGLLADSYTDLIQGLILIIGLLILATYFISAEGWEMFGNIPSEKLDAFNLSQNSLLELIESWSVPIIGSLASAELITRAIAARSAQTARSSSIRAFFIYLIVGLIPVSFGLIGPQVLPNLDSPEQLLPLLAEKYLPAALYAIFSGALISAILSTVDSALLVAGSLMSHNLIIPILGKRDMDEATKIRIARLSVISFGIIAYIMALYAEGVYTLVEEASAFGSAGIVVCVLFAAYGGFGGRLTAGTTLVTGISSYVLFAYVIVTSYPFISSLTASLLVYTTMGFWEKRFLSVQNNIEVQ